MREQDGRARRHVYCEQVKTGKGEGCAYNTAITGMSRGKYTATYRMDVAGIVMPYNPENIMYTKKEKEVKND